MTQRAEAQIMPNPYNGIAQYQIPWMERGELYKELIAVSFGLPAFLYQNEPRFVEDLIAAGTPRITVASQTVFFSVFDSAEFADIQIREYLNVDSKDTVSPQMYVLTL